MTTETDAAPVTESDYNTLFCAEQGGQQETRHNYSYGSEQSYVVVDCETANMVWEGGLDKRSSLDSIQQALFFANLTGKEPGVVIYDTDGIEGQYEYQIRTVAEQIGIRYESYLWQPELEMTTPNLPDFLDGLDFWGF